MISRAFGLTLAAVAGAPLLAALLVSVCESTTTAVIACLALAAGGVLGAIVGAAQILRWDHERRSPHAAEVDALARRDRS